VKKKNYKTDECPYASCIRKETMKLNEAIAPGGKELTQVKKIADQASKVIISGIDKITSKTNMADEFQYYSMVKIMLDKRFEQILVKRFDRHSGS
jgi:hypothetical protein